MGDTLYAPYSTHFQLQNHQKDFSIPRAQAPASPYNDYEGRRGDS